MKKKYLIFDREWGCSNVAVWLYLGNFLLFPTFLPTRNGVWQLNLIRKKVFGERSTYFFRNGNCLVCLALKNLLRKKGLWRKPNVFLIGGREYIAHHTKSRFYISYLKDCSLVHSFTILFEFGFHLINLIFSHVFKLNRLTAHRRCNCIDTDL